MDLALIGGLVGVLAALWVASVDRRARTRKAVEAAQRMRAAIAADMDILKQLPADSPAAARLEDVINLRLSTYLGRRPLRLTRTLMWLLVLAGATAWMAIELESSIAPSDFAVYGAGAGFFGAMLLQAASSTLRVVRRRRSAEVTVPTSGSEADHATATPGNEAVQE